MNQTPGRRPDAELRLPAESAYVAVLRMTTAGLAARVDFTLDDIEDLRIAVGEACSMLLETADPGGWLYTTFELDESEVTVTVAADAAAGTPPDRDSWAWQVLAATTVDAATSASDGQVRIRLTVKSGAPV